MSCDGRRADKPTERRTDPEIIDAELASQLSDLVDAIEAITWSDVPSVERSDALRFNRDVIEARSRLLTRRGIIRGDLP